MTIYEYTNNVIEHLKDSHGLDTEMVTSFKRNDVLCTGIRMKIDTSCEFQTSPIVYIDSYFSDNASVDSVTEEVAGQLQCYCPFDVTILKEYAKVKPLLRLLAVAKDTNGSYLEDVVLVEKYDMCFYVAVVLDKGNATVNVKSNMLSMWGVDEETLLRDAVENTKENMMVLNLSDMLSSVAGIDIVAEESPLQMHVVTSKSFSFGAGILYDDDSIIEVVKSLGLRSAYVIPSSIHEVIVVSSENIGVDYVLDMVRSVNDAEVSADEILAYSVFLVDTESRVISQFEGE